MKIRKIFSLKLTHARKAWIGAIIAELILVFLLGSVVLPTSSREKEMEIHFSDDDFNFEDLKKEEKIRVPDIDEAIRKARLYSRASNQWLKKAYDGPETQTPPSENPAEKNQTETEDEQNETSASLSKKMRKNVPGVTVNDRAGNRKTGREELKNFKGAGNIEFYLPRRYKIRLINPVYTCPDYMHGVVRVNIWVDRKGRVEKAVVDPSHSTVSYVCLTETALKYAYKTRFNPSNQAPELQKGYIIYYF